jgi:hypothetical protein
MSYLKNSVWWGGMGACESHALSCDRSLKVFLYPVIVGESKRRY